MDSYYTVSQYAKLIGKDAGNIRRMLINGTLEGEKLGNQWIIPKDTVYPDDKRIKNGNYKNWRKKKDIWDANKELMSSLVKMSSDISKIYGSALEKIILYGSYARGEQTEESDIDIAVMINNEGNEKMHDAMVDIVVDYELEQGVTISVVPIEYEQYQQWIKTLPYYKNIDKEGIVLWKTV